MLHTAASRSTACPVIAPLQTPDAVYHIGDIVFPAPLTVIHHIHACLCLLHEDT